MQAEEQQHEQQDMQQEGEEGEVSTRWDYCSK